MYEFCDSYISLNVYQTWKSTLILRLFYVIVVKVHMFNFPIISKIYTEPFGVLPKYA